MDTCEVNLSGWHVPSRPPHKCRCGREATREELAALDEQRRRIDLALREARTRMKVGAA